MEESLKLSFRVTEASKKKLRVGLGEGESVLSDWISRHAHVCWAEHPAPWDVEDHALNELVLPLNMDGNLRPECRPFVQWLSDRREQRRAEARSEYRRATFDR